MIKLISALVFVIFAFSEGNQIPTKKRLQIRTESSLRFVKMLESEMPQSRLNSRNFTHYMKTVEEMEEDMNKNMISREDKEWFKEYIKVSVPLFEFPCDTFKDYLKVVKDVYRLFIAQLKDTEKRETLNSKYWKRVLEITHRDPVWNVY